jgi:Na+/H+ antiporter
MEGRTAWSRNVGTPLREFLGTETGSAVVLLAATIAALIWVNVNATSYTDVWSTKLSIQRRLGHLPGPPALAEQRPDDVLLLRHRARGTSRVRPRGAA